MRSPEAWQEALCLEAKKGEIQSGSSGYRSRRQKVERVIFSWQQTETVDLGVFRSQVKQFLGQAESREEKILGRSLLGRVDYHLRKMIVESEEREIALQLKGAARVYQATRGINLESIDYEALTRRLLSEGVVNLWSLDKQGIEQMLTKENHKLSERLRKKIGSAWEKAREKLDQWGGEVRRVVLPTALATLIVIGGLGYSAWELKEERPVNSIDRGKTTLSVEKEPSVRPTILPGEKIVLGGEAFDFHDYELKTVLPLPSMEFGLNELVLGGYSFTHPQKLTLWAIHCGGSGQSLPGDILLNRLDRPGKGLIIKSKDGIAGLRFVGRFSLARENFVFDEGFVSREARNRGFDIDGQKHLVLVTCDQYSEESQEYETREIMLFAVA
jgi:hypothetical protein